MKTEQPPRGFALLELVLVIALLGAIALGAAFFGDRARQAAKAEGTVAALSSVVSKVRQYFRPAGSYTAVSQTTLRDMNIPGDPLYWHAGSAKWRDPWGGALVFAGNAAGAAPSFVIGVGSNEGTYLDPEACVAIATALATDAVAARVGVATALTTTNGLIGGGSVYKAPGGTPDVATLVSVCKTASPAGIVLQYN